MKILIVLLFFFAPSLKADSNAKCSKPYAMEFECIKDNNCSETELFWICRLARQFDADFWHRHGCGDFTSEPIFKCDALECEKKQGGK